MLFSDAAKQSSINIAFRNVESGRDEVYDGASKGFFFYDYTLSTGTTGTLSRRPGRGSLKKADWAACEGAWIVPIIEAWKAKQEGRGLTIEKPWQEACKVSQVGRAVKYSEPGKLWLVRDVAGNTFQITNMGQTFARLTGPFKEYDGWEPMGSLSEYAKTDLTVSTNYKIENAKPVVFEPRRQLNYSNPEAPKSKVLPETITAAGETIKTLKESLQYISDDTQKGEIVQQMLSLSRSLSWHLREDRNKW